jgi:hypothetical protein
MANVTIPNLTSATTITPSKDLMVLEQTNGTRKATLSQIFTSSATSGSGLGITSGGVYTIKSGLDSDISDINTLLGNTSIASIGDGTVTGAVSKINSDLSNCLTTPIYKAVHLHPSNQLQAYVDSDLIEAKWVDILLKNAQNEALNRCLRVYHGATTSARSEISTGNAETVTCTLSDTSNDTILYVMSDLVGWTGNVLEIVGIMIFK